MAMTTTVDRLFSAGFPIGPDPNGPCEQQCCRHLWGNHLLIALGLDPLDGGVYRCPYVDCECTGTWDVPEAARAVVEAYRRRQRGEE